MPGARPDRTVERLRRLEQAQRCVGTTLDLFRTAEEVADMAVTGLADVAAVELLDAVLHGDAPPAGPAAERTVVRRAAAAAADRAQAPGVYDVGDAWVVRFGSPYAQALADLRPRLVTRLAPDDGWLLREPDRARLARAEGAHSMIALPLTARGVLLGMVSLYRLGTARAFDGDDLDEAVALVAHSAVCVDNARRHAREKTLARLVQRTLVPRRLPAHVAAETAWTYLPVAAGGAWFDVVPLSGARVACVVGEVDGHGMAAVSLMGRLSTAVATLAGLDLEPDEILGRVHEITLSSAEQRPSLSLDDSSSDPLTAGCVIAVYDPIAGTCTVARAGHPAPIAVLPGGESVVVDTPAGPALGGRGEPRYPLAHTTLPAGSVLALGTAGLPADPTPALVRALGSADDDLQRACDAVLAEILPDTPGEDTLLLLARTRVLGPERTRVRVLPNRPESVAEARRFVAAQLEEWELDALVFSTELLVSELVTNGVKYSSDDVELRLIVRENTLVCEVTDTNGAAPTLRRASDDDEGGRGLFLVARFTHDWGVRPEARGKTIWAEQPLAVDPDAGD